MRQATQRAQRTAHHRQCYSPGTTSAINLPPERSRLRLARHTGRVSPREGVYIKCVNLREILTEKFGKNGIRTLCVWVLGELGGRSGGGMGVGCPLIVQFSRSYREGARRNGRVAKLSLLAPLMTTANYCNFIKFLIPVITSVRN